MSVQAVSPITLEELYSPIRDELRRVEEALSRELSAHSQIVEDFMAHVSSFRGKRLRPALALLAGKCFGETDGAHIHLSVFVELIHTATLIHDDILDEAELRRGIPTVSAKWGTGISVLLGDYVFSKAFSVFSQFDGMSCLPYVAETTNLMCEGELMQLHCRYDMDLTEELYLKIAEQKTASLCGLSARLGARLAGASEPETEALRRFGLRFGLAFQLTDDCLDLMGRERVVGKSLGTDLMQGKLTLPTIRLIKMLAPEEREEVAGIIRDGFPEHSRPRLRELATRYGAVESSLETARQLVREGQQALGCIPDSPARQSLIGLADIILSRER